MFMSIQQKRKEHIKAKKEAEETEILKKKALQREKVSMVPAEFEL